MKPSTMAAELVICLSLACLPAAAAPTGLNTIPTADLIPVHQWTATLQNGNSSTTEEPNLVQQPQPLYQFQFGLTPEVEGGIDFGPARSPRDYQPEVNFKWKPIAEDYHRPAVAIGAASLGPDFQPSYYAAVTRTINYSKVQYNKFKAHARNIKLRGRRVHAGFLHSGAGNFPFVGADWELSDQFILYSDWISGGANAVTFGTVFTIDTANSVTAFLGVGNQQSQLNGFTANFVHTFKW